MLGLQRKLFGAEHTSVAITSACMGDVYEKLGENSTAIQYFEDALKIKSATQGRHSLDVARILHKVRYCTLYCNFLDCADLARNLLQTLLCH